MISEQSVTKKLDQYIVNLRNEDHDMTSLRYLAEIPLIPDSCPAEPKLEDLYLWLFPQEGSVDSEKEEVK